MKKANRQYLADRAALLARDLNEVLHMLEGRNEVLLARPALYRKDDIVEGLLKACLVMYARNFLANESLGEPYGTIHWDDLPCSKDRELRALHDSVVLIRHDLVAHAPVTHHRSEVLQSDAGGVVRESKIPWIGLSFDIIEFHKLVLQVRNAASALSQRIDAKYPVPKA
ncbi:hypothetical protein ACO2Q9_19105 [Variovorax sp. VNK109]|uniref:hypothetical protein n=1 Tax=Variovorax sp. VNK109 TaxID=3400919 RepID=UPI003C0DE4AC